MAPLSSVSNVKDVQLISFPTLSSGSGDLIPVEFGTLPFVPFRSFSVANVPHGAERGLHAHRECSQLLFALSGDILVQVNDGEATLEFLLNAPTMGLLIPPLVWASQRYLSRNSILWVYASHPYSRDDYIEDFETYRALVRGLKEMPE
jgi:UDP-2-acetamido-3-amino-2,3-dideoxy-glucuronate N-acetyltransferase